MCEQAQRLVTKNSRNLTQQSATKTTGDTSAHVQGAVTVTVDRKKGVANDPSKGKQSTAMATFRLASGKQMDQQDKEFDAARAYFLRKLTKARQFALDGALTPPGTRAKGCHGAFCQNVSVQA